MAAVDTEPHLQRLLERRKARRAMPPYAPMRDHQVVANLEGFFRTEAPEASVRNVRRLGGGASKEMFLFELETPGKPPVRYILRMDPLEAISDTDRRREDEILHAFQGVVPAPRPAWLDADGDVLGRPAGIIEFVPGVTKATADAALKVSGLGTHLGPRLRAPLREEFLDILVKIHGFDWRKANLKHFDAPIADPKQAARWQVEYWTDMWRQDSDFAAPIATLAENWMRANLPDCTDPVIVHGDYRTGNYLFDEASGKITAMLDWELAYIGDFHDDLAWTLIPVFATMSDGVLRAGDLYEREELIACYEKRSGRTINRRTLHFYEVLATYRCLVITAATGMAAARSAHNHQDILLTYLASVGPMFRSGLCRLLSQEEFA